MTGSQVQAAKADDLGAQAVSKELGGLPVVESPSVAPGSVRVVLANDYTGPGSGLDGSDPTLATVDPAAAGSTDSTDRRSLRHRRSSPPAPTTRSASTRRDHSQFGDTRSADGRRPGRPADHLLRRRHRRTHRAVDRHAGQLGRQDRQPAARRTGRRSGSRVAVLLPAHWQTAAVLFGIWWIGAEVVLGLGGAADIALCTADRLSEADDAVGVGRDRGAVAGSVRQAGARPARRGDRLRHAVRVHGDQISPERHPGAALDGRSVADVLAGAQASAAAQGFTADDRVMSMAGWDTADELTDNLLAVFAVGASLVQVANPDPTALDRRRQMEKVTRDLRPLIDLRSRWAPWPGSRTETAVSPQQRASATLRQ